MCYTSKGMRHMDTCIDVISFLEWLSPFFLNTFISEETRGQTLTITPFLCMCLFSNVSVLSILPFDFGRGFISQSQAAGTVGCGPTCVLHNIALSS